MKQEKSLTGFPVRDFASHLHKLLTNWFACVNGTSTKLFSWTNQTVAFGLFLRLAGLPGIGCIISALCIG